jgi:hypothetical protein
MALFPAFLVGLAAAYLFGAGAAFAVLAPVLPWWQAVALAAVWPVLLVVGIDLWG